MTSKNINFKINKTVMIIQLLEIYDNIFVVNINTVMNEVFSTLCDDQ